jgi:hypothetical protein
MSSPTRIKEMVSVLCGGAQTTDQIFNALSSRYPDANWTLELLNLYLTVGSKQGRWKAVSNAPRWMLRSNMSLLNYINSQYEDSCITGITNTTGCGPVVNGIP